MGGDRDTAATEGKRQLSKEGLGGRQLEYFVVSKKRGSATGGDFEEKLTYCKDCRGDLKSNDWGFQKIRLWPCVGR